jgi:hypothetical protein
MHPVLLQHVTWKYIGFGLDSGQHAQGSGTTPYDTVVNTDLSSGNHKLKVPKEKAKKGKKAKKRQYLRERYVLDVVLHLGAFLI